MAELNCELCQERAAELALGVLGGRERAETLAHLQDCDRCQDLVADLATTANRLFEQLLPEADPPPGLDQRIVDAITPVMVVAEDHSAPAAAASTSRERFPVAVAVLATVLLMAGGLVFSAAPRASRSASPDSSGPVVQRTADMMAAPLISGQQQIGTAYLFAHRPVWVVVSIAGADDPSTATLNDTVSCDLVRKDGTTIALGSFALNDGHGDWATDAPVDPTTLADVRLTVHVGRVMSYASFTQPVAAPTPTSTPPRPAALTGPSTSPATPASGVTSSTKTTKQGKESKDPQQPGKDPKGPTQNGELKPTEELKALSDLTNSQKVHPERSPDSPRKMRGVPLHLGGLLLTGARPGHRHHQHKHRSDDRHIGDAFKGITLK